ncbi:MAG: hemerythrin domain-containing protein [Candidatus Geothermincolia bacterium]
MKELFEHLMEEHQTVQKLMKKIDATSTRGMKARVEAFEKLKMEIVPHVKAEEAVLYEQLMQKATGKLKELTLMAFEEHRVAEMLLMELDQMPKDDERWKALFQVFMTNVMHHVEEEEEMIFPMAQNKLRARLVEEMYDEYESQEQGLKMRMAA